MCYVKHREKKQKKQKNQNENKNRVCKICFIVELYTEIPPVFSLFLKMLETCFFFNFFNIQYQGTKPQKSFILYQ